MIGERDCDRERSKDDGIVSMTRDVYIREKTAVSEREREREVRKIARAREQNGSN